MTTISGAGRRRVSASSSTSASRVLLTPGLRNMSSRTTSTGCRSSPACVIATVAAPIDSKQRTAKPFCFSLLDRISRTRSSSSTTNTVSVASASTGDRDIDRSLNPMSIRHVGDVPAAPFSISARKPLSRRREWAGVKERDQLTPNEEIIRKNGCQLVDERESIRRPGYPHCRGNADQRIGAGGSSASSGAPDSIRGRPSVSAAGVAVRRYRCGIL